MLATRRYWIANPVATMATAISSVATAAVSPATTGLRRHHRQARSAHRRPPRPDRPVLQVPLQVLRQLAGRRIAVSRLAVDRLQADRLQVPRDLGIRAGCGRVGSDWVTWWISRSRSASANAGSKVSSS